MNLSNTYTKKLITVSRHWICSWWQKYFERIGDHAQNIAEWVEFAITGKHKGNDMIYYVEDDNNIRDLVVYTLDQSGFEAKGFKSSTEFHDASDKQIPDLILLDIMLPGDDGLSILKSLKASKKTAEIPVIMVTAKSTEFDKIIGLDSGADDYIVKPFGVMELVARVRALMRRTNRISTPEIIEEGDLVVDREKRKVTICDKEIFCEFLKLKVA